MADEVVLLSFPYSSFGVRVMIALAEKGVEYEYKVVDLFAERRDPVLLEANPVYKKVPVLIHNGKPVCESLAIVEYIDETWCRGAPLMPRGAYERANTRFWADFTNKKIYENGSILWKGKGEAQAQAKQGLIENLKLLEGELGDKPYFNGENFGFLDIAILPFSTLFYTFETFGNFSIEEECPNLIAWVKRCGERDSVARSLPDPRKFYEVVCDFKKKFGLE